jgi:DNA-binding MarR family transcriptional regulator
MIEPVNHIQAMFLKMAQDREITGEVGRVLYYCFSKLDFENYIHVAQTEIAEALGLQKANVSRAVRVLCDKQIILKGPKTGRTITYRLNPEYGWKGKVKNLNAARFTVIQGGKGETEKGPSA